MTTEYLRRKAKTNPRLARQLHLNELFATRVDYLLRLKDLEVEIEAAQAECQKDREERAAELKQWRETMNK